MLLTRLKYLREHQGLTLRQLAGKSKVPYSAISLLENGKREPQGRTVHKLAQALDVEINELYDNEPVQPAPVIIQPANNNKTITPGRAKAKKQAAPAPAVSYWWVIDHEG